MTSRASRRRQWPRGRRLVRPALVAERQAGRPGDGARAWARRSGGRGGAVRADGGPALRRSRRTPAASGRSADRRRGAGTAGSASRPSTPWRMTGTASRRSQRTVRAFDDDVLRGQALSRQLGPVPHISLHVSSDGGNTWAAAALCAQGILAVRSGRRGRPEHRRRLCRLPRRLQRCIHALGRPRQDPGRLRSRPTATSRNDKPALATSDDGRDVYVSWNGPTGGDPWRPWAARPGGDLDTAEARRLSSATSSLTPTFCMTGRSSSPRATSPSSGPGGAPEGVVKHHVFVSRDGGATWDDRVLDTVNVGEACIAEGCSPDFYIGHDAISPTAGAISNT